MVIDASAMVAILMLEPDGAIFERALARAHAKRMSPVNWFEVASVIGGRNEGARERFDVFWSSAGIEIVPVDTAQMLLADQARRIYGRTVHGARLNLGDCFAYALARSLNEPLLYKGNDFAQTDIVAAV